MSVIASLREGQLDTGIKSCFFQFTNVIDEIELILALLQGWNKLIQEGQLTNFTPYSSRHALILF